MGDVLEYLVITFCIAICALVLGLMIWIALYDHFWRRFHWLTEMKTWTCHPEYMEWPDVVAHLERGEGTLLQYQARHFWALHWHARHLAKCEAVGERVSDADCFYTAQPLGYESMFVLHRRFPKVAIYCIRVDYRGSFS